MIIMIIMIMMILILSADPDCFVGAQLFAASAGTYRLDDIHI